MADANTMTNLQLQDDILKNLLLGLQKQSQYYVQKINETGELTEERKNFEKELSDINKVLTELSSKALSYTVQELDNLRTQFNDRLTQLNGVISDLQINTLKIEFDSLTPQQKEFLKGQKGDKGEKGDNLYQFAKMFGFLGTESEFLESLKGQKGDTGSQGIQGEKGDTGSQGIQGEKGDAGSQGIQGEKGDTGSQGIQGEKGDTGSQGIQGEKGDTGSQGIQGEKGDTGSQGIQGEKGDTGSQGIQGEKGDTGIQGIQGEKGLDGAVTFESLTPEQKATLKGDKGDKGDAGIQGFSLTYNDLTPEQKQEFANLVPVSGGGGSSSSLNKKFHFLRVNTSQHLVIKTNLKLTDTSHIIIERVASNGTGHYFGLHHLCIFSVDGVPKIKKQAIINDSGYALYADELGNICFVCFDGVYLHGFTNVDVISSKQDVVVTQTYTSSSSIPSSWVAL